MSIREAEECQSRLERIKIENRVYFLNKFDPLSGFEYGLKLLSLFGPNINSIFELQHHPGRFYLSLVKALGHDESAKLMKQALGRCLSPENEALDDPGVSNRWFARHPGDMYELAGQAIWHLVKDFFLPAASTAAKSLSEPARSEASPPS